MGLEVEVPKNQSLNANRTGKSTPEAAGSGRRVGRGNVRKAGNLDGSSKRRHDRVPSLPNGVVWLFGSIPYQEKVVGISNLARRRTEEGEVDG